MAPDGKRTKKGRGPRHARGRRLSPREQAYLISDSDGPMLLYVMEVEDIERSQLDAGSSLHPIDADHERVMGRAIGDPVEAELLLDLVRDS